MNDGRRGAALVLAVVMVMAGIGVDVGSAAGADTVRRIAGDDRISTAVAISRLTYDAADAVIVVRADGFADALAAAPLAAQHGGPVLLTDSDTLAVAVRNEIRRLRPDRIYILGGTAAVTADVAKELADLGEVERIDGDDRFVTAAAVADLVAASDGVVVASGSQFADAMSAAPLAAFLGWPLVLTDAARLPAVSAAAIRGRSPAEILVVGGEFAVGREVVEQLADIAPTRRLAGTDRYETALAVHRESLERGMSIATLWLATGRSFPDALAAGPAIAASGGSLLLVDGQDLRDPLPTARQLGEHLRSGDLGLLVLLGGEVAITASAPWQLRLVEAGTELPRGGFTLFPRHQMIAFYGHHTSPRLGVLGEQPPDEAYARLLRQAAGYEAGDRSVLPTFDLIVDVAQREAGDDGDYSTPSTIEEIAPWLDAAERLGVYLLLDIQSGRTDFLTAVRRYEEVLVHPNVGVALDPEWRLDPGERPGQTIGEVDVAELNAVTDYLAEIVRRENLPQKLLMVHLFQTRQIVGRASLAATPEVDVMLHMDGEGSQAAKLNTYRNVTDTTGTFPHGFKLFYDEDTNVFTPAQVLRITPLPDLISYQ